MIEVVRSSSAPASALGELVCDVLGWPDTLPTFDAVRHVGGPVPTDVGSRFEVRQPGLLKAEYEVTDWEPGRGFTWVGRTPGVVTTGTHYVVETPEGSTLTLGLIWSGPLAPVVRLLLTKKGQAMVESEAATLVRRAEGG